MITEKIYNLIVADFIASLKEAQRWIIHLDNKNAYMPAGHNGPHYALETPIRNTSHWSVAYLIAAKFNLLKEASKISNLFRNWLLNDNVHYQKGCYVLRQSGKSDWCNGVIGHAWVLEALSRFTNFYSDKKSKERADEIVSKHKFNKRASAWHRYDPFTKRYSVDFTFDHQAWFAASLCDYNKTENVKTFLDHCNSGGFRIRKNGLINHLHFAPVPKNYVNRLQYKFNDLINPKRSKIVEEGYHIYTLFPLSRIKLYIPDHPFFESKVFQDALNYCTKENILKMKTNCYGFSYNAPGLELPMTALAFGTRMPIKKEDIESIYNAQNSYSRPECSALHTQNNSDALTLSARIYELALFIEAYKEKEKMAT